MFKKYTIAGESNPMWQLAEPAILKTWAEGMAKASIPDLYLTHVMALFMSSIMFLGGFILRLLVVGVTLLIGYVLFEQTLSLAASAVIPGIETGGAAVRDLGEGKQWPYQMLGYVIIIKATIFVFGSNFTSWLSDCSLYLLLMILGMVPLKWIAGGLLKDNYFAQLIAKSSFMGVEIAQTISAAPRETRERYERIYELYLNSNSEVERRELEKFCRNGNSSEE